jgi:hypothetical protein
MKGSKIKFEDKPKKAPRASKLRHPKKTGDGYAKTQKKPTLSSATGSGSTVGIGIPVAIPIPPPFPFGSREDEEGEGPAMSPPPRVSPGEKEGVSRV